MKFHSALLATVLLPVAAAAQTTPNPTPQTAPGVTPVLPPDQTSPQTPPKSADDLPDTPSTTEGIVVPPEPNGPTAVIDTSMGRLTCQFFQKQAPITVANFIGLANGTKDYTDPTTGQKVTHTRFYDGTTFHRVIANFMIQGGDRAGSGRGDPGFYIPDEFAPGLRFDREGRLAMANAGPGTGGSQFFVTEAPVPELNGKHTIFGQCDAHSVMVVRTIARVEKDASDKPLDPVIVHSVIIVPEGQPLPPEPKFPGSDKVGATPAGTTN